MTRLAALTATAGLVAVAAAIALLSGGGDTATIYAATSLRDVFPKIEPAQKFQFGGSNTLQLQIERGAPADLFAAASPVEPERLRSQGRCETPATFATNRVVMVVPSGNPGRIDSVQDLMAGERKRLSVGAAGVPVGDYTRELLRELGASSVLQHNIVSDEANVGIVVAKVQSGDADAGFVYATDQRIAAGRLDAIEPPPGAQPKIRYDLCIVRRDGADTRAARAFADRVLSSEGRRVLTEAGYGVPPR